MRLSTQQAQTTAVSLLTFIVGQLVAFLPSLGPDKQNLISAGSILIAIALNLAGGIHHIATKGNRQSANTTPPYPAVQLTAAPQLPPVVFSYLATGPAVATPEEKLRQQLLAAGIEPTA